LKIFFFLNIEAAKKISFILIENDSTDIKLTAINILKACFPRNMWEQDPSLIHAAEWLLWLEEIKPNLLFEPFIKEITSIWIQFDSRLQSAYSCFNAEHAQKLLHHWVCYSELEVIQKLGLFPVEIPKRWRDIQKDFWNAQIIQTNGNYFLEFLEHESSHVDKLLIVDQTIDYFQNNSNELTGYIFNKLIAYTSGKKHNKLIKLQPQKDPGDVPENPNDVTVWFQKEYLPYRERAIILKNQESIERSLECAQQFAKWYLQYYPRAIAKGKDLAPFATHLIKEKNKNHINFLVILDGLNMHDAKILVNEFLSESKNTNLSLLENSTTFSLLPTVTEFTKTPMVYGTLSIEIENLDKLGIDIPDKENPSKELKNAGPGDIIIWRIQEPDTTYHKEGQSSDLAAKVEGQLGIVCKRILAAIDEVSSFSPIHIIITSDHGRLIGKSKRTIKVPDGMQAHGRAAWGKVKKKFNNQGFIIDNNLVYLSKDTFNLNDLTAAIILSDESFEHDKFKEENSPHGGLFPEEVLIPWIVFETIREKPSFTLLITGSSEANKPGHVTLSITNLSNFSAKLVSVEFDFYNHKEKFLQEKNINPKKESSFVFTIQRWPSKDEIQSGSSRVVIGLPNGEILQYSVSINQLDTDSMYTHALSLDDF
jgi:hypothetical protein